jgi:transposase-like protein
MNLENVFCPREAYFDKPKRGAGNIVWHDRQRRRCKCKRCGHTFSYRRGTLFYGLRSPEQTVLWVVTLVAYGCPISAIVAAFGLDERTVAVWMQRAGAQAYVFHRQQVRRLDLGQVQVDEVRVKLQGVVVWAAMAIAVGSRLWLGVVCSPARDKHLARQIITWVYNWAKQAPLLISFDGWRAYVMACRKLFREPLYTGRVGSVRQIAWPCLTLVQLVKYTPAGRFHPRRWVVSGSCTMLVRLIQRSQGAGTINTAYIERLFATFRGRLAHCTRRTRHPARHLATVEAHLYLVGCLYNFCRLHTSLRNRTPAMTAALTDRLWSVSEFFWWRPNPYWASTV